MLHKSLQEGDLIGIIEKIAGVVVGGAMVVTNAASAIVATVATSDETKDDLEAGYIVDRKIEEVKEENSNLGK